ncbi:peroxisome biogenesis protein 6 [Iris pallida]|uniref:Peroxisomal ATPase PEX6 n=1 Tax=Iris pallida TaxID=29817 RepID=A0AAX6HR34_IRIPA|nr:peroxisome biogenesis protein 6 [Iris pallida]
MVEKWRRPLILSSTRNLLDSVLSSARPEEGSRRRDEASSDRSPPFLRLKAGILRFADGGVGGGELSEDSLLVGVSSSVLKKLSITTGSLILVKNAGTNVGRIVKVIVLDRPVVDPPEKEGTSQVDRPSNSHYATNIFSSFTYPSNDHVTLDEEVTYIAPLLAFNLGLHVSFLEVLLRGGQESLMSLFEIDGNEKSDEEKKVSDVHVELVQWTNLPGYASHLRISFVKIPECGMLGSLKGRSTTEEDDRQLMIDSALNDYFKVDRFLARGDIFSIHVNWNCRSEMCASCSQEADKRFSNNVIYFKVMAMEPLNELILRVSYSETALILGGSASSAIPPHLFAKRSKDFIPMQVDTVKLLSSVLAPALCPSSLSSKFRVALFLHGSPGCGKRTVVRYVAHCLGLHVVEYSCHDLMSSSERKASTALANTFKAAHRYTPSVLLLRHFDVFGNLSSNEGSPFDQVGITSELASIIRDFTEPFSEEEDSYSEHAANNGLYLVQAERLSKHPVLLIAAADSSEGLQPPIRRCFSHEISMGPLTEEQRANLLFQSLSGVSKIHGENLEELTKDIIGQTSGFMPRDLHALVADASASFIERTVKYGDNENNIAGANLVQDGDRSSIIASEHLEKEDFSKALERSKKRNASALGTPKVPNVKWEDVGGLEEVKKSILDTVQLPLLHKDLFSSGLRKRSGVLLYGPPGTGKTLLAKAVATECSLNFLSVKGPELINMYIGESEKNVRDIFQKARSARPCVIFFDELDSLAPARGASGDSGGVMDRVVSQMLAEIDGLNEATEDLFIIGASNRPDLIDPALLRPGRFDKLLYVGVNSDASYRERVLTALCRKFKLHENVSLLSVAKRCPPNFTGADMYALCADAWFLAAKRMVSFNSADSSTADEADSVTVEIDDFMKVLGELSPSLSLSELKKYELLRDQFEGTLK